MNKIEETLSRIKALFADAPAPAAPAAPAPAPAPPAPPAGNSNAKAQYAVDGGVPVFVNISDDNIADIDQGDSVFTDAALTAPYPDGSYKVSGTDFGFTVAGGIVTAVDDKDGKGPGTPVQDAPAPAAPAPAPDFSTPAAMRKEFEKFASNSTPSLVDLAVMVKALFENVFGYQLAQANQSEAIASYKDSFTKQEDKIKKQEEIIQGLFQVIEELSKVPTENPVEQPKTIFNKQTFESKEERVKGIASTLQKLRKKDF